jgi:hypothetical protein
LEVRSRLTRWWLAFANATADLLEEAIFRLALAFNVLTGRVPIETEKRAWIRSRETPALLNVHDWTDGRHIFSVLIWPSLETPADQADQAFHERVREVKEAIARGAADRALCTRFETDFGLRWDHKRQVWTATDGFAFEPPQERARGASG